ncbi:MAG: aminotransferase class I/II-fold pyridoxal phosphate-dependent enzyme, partial [Actinomycetota bacterium]
MRTADRIRSLPPYLFADLDKKVAAKQASGTDVISLGIGDPDLPTPRHVVEALREAVEDPTTHRYPSYYGLPAFRLAIARFYARRFGVELDPDLEVLPLIGSKEGVAHLAFAFIDTGDEALIPDPGYPVYATSVLLAGGRSVPMALDASNGFQPDFDELRPSPRTKLVWLDYPSNPTAAVAELPFFERAVAFAREHDLLLSHDAAYSEITFDGFAAPSVLQVPGAKDVAIEFGSLSKTYNMTGWRVGFVVGNPEAVRALATLKTNLDSGIFNAVQRAGVVALDGPLDHIEQMRAVYQKRRDVVVGALQDIG